MFGGARGLVDIASGGGIGGAVRRGCYGLKSHDMSPSRNNKAVIMLSRPKLHGSTEFAVFALIIQHLITT